MCLCVIGVAFIQASDKQENTVVTPESGEELEQTGAAETH